MLDRLRLMRRGRIAQREAARLSAHRPGPAMHLALDDVPTRLVVEPVGQRIERTRNQRTVVLVAE